MIHATHGTDPERAGNAAVTVDTDTDPAGGVTLAVEAYLDASTVKAHAVLTTAEARAVAVALMSAADEATDYAEGEE